MARPRPSLSGFLRRWLKQEEGVSFVEAALLMPLLCSMLLGVFDLGNGLLASQKSVMSSQIAADLIARYRSVGDGDINEAVEAARLALQPFDTAAFGIDIASVQFDDRQRPQILWRKTVNMSPDDNAIDGSEDMGEEGTGLIVVTVSYLYQPVFSGFVINAVPIREVAYAKGRQTSVVPHV